MKLKLDDAGNVVVQDGKPVYLKDDGTEVPFDVVQTVATITRLNSEAKGHREKFEAADAKLKLYDGIEDPDAARKALETVANLDSGQLVAAGKVEEIKAAAKRAADEQVASATKSVTEQLKAITGERDTLRGQLHSEKLGNAFARSKFIGEKSAIPADLVQARFGTQFKIEDGKIVAYDGAGNKLYSPARPGELAEFDEALEMIVASYPYKDQILKGTGGSGGGGRSAANGGNGGKTISRKEFFALDPITQAAKIKEGFKPED